MRVFGCESFDACDDWMMRMLLTDLREGIAHCSVEYCLLYWVVQRFVSRDGDYAST